MIEMSWPVSIIHVLLEFNIVTASDFNPFTAECSQENAFFNLFNNFFVLRW